MSLARTCVFFTQLILSEATRAGVPPQLALAIAHNESHCNPTAVSDSGALGLFQVLPLWRYEQRGKVARLCGGTNLFDPRTNACYGLSILSYYHRLCRQSWPCALRRYSGNAPNYYANVRRQMQQQPSLMRLPAWSLFSSPNASADASSAPLKSTNAIAAMCVAHTTPLRLLTHSRPTTTRRRMTLQT